MRFWWKRTGKRGPRIFLAVFFVDWRRIAYGFGSGALAVRE